MLKEWRQGNWLLIDAAGPTCIIGIVREGLWLCKQQNEGDFLEWFQPSVEQLLKSADLSLPELSGALYATGPGSTLGLRLAAMFIRSLMVLPALQGWKCYEYQNLHLALADMKEGSESERLEAVAPWRRDRLHHATMDPGTPSAFHSDALSPEAAISRKIPGVNLGRRPANAASDVLWRPYPLERIPELLMAYPELLTATHSPTPYQAEDPEFARWSSKRHAAK